MGFKQLVAVGTAALIGLPAAASAMPSLVQMSFSETGFATAYSSTFTPSDTISFVQHYGGYTLTIDASVDNLYGTTALGDNPFLSLQVAVGNTGTTPPAHPVTIGISMTGLGSSPGTIIGFDASYTGIFQAHGTANYATYYDQTNTLFGTQFMVTSFAGLAFQSNSNDQTVEDHVNAPYSMSLFITFNPAASVHPTLDGQLSVIDVPEPASVAALAGGIMGLSLVLRRQRARGQTLGLLVGRNKN